MSDEKKCRVAIYCRVAYAEQGDESDIDAQLHILQDCARSLGFADCPEYLDNGYSGLTPDRPGFARMMEDIQARKIQALLVKDQARIFRDYRRFHKWLHNLRKQGVEVYTQHGRLTDETHPLMAPFPALIGNQQEI